MRALWNKHAEVRAFNSDVADAIDDVVSAINVPPFQTSSILFPITQAASTNANTLDDYREGTWTPSLGGTATYAARSGTYTKIGRMVQLQGHINVAAIGTGATGTITGAPFAAAVTSPGSVGYFAGAAHNVVWVSCYIQGSLIVITDLTAAASTVNVPATFLGNFTDFYFTIVYAATA